MFLINIDLILFPHFAAGHVWKKYQDQILYIQYCISLPIYIIIYYNTTSVLILIAHKESLAQPEQPGAQPEVLSRAPLVVARTRLVTKGDRAFAVRAPEVCKWAVSGDKASQNTLLSKSLLKAHLYSIEMYQEEPLEYGNSHFYYVRGNALIFPLNSRL